MCTRSELESIKILKQSVIDMEEESAVAISQDIIRKGYSSKKAIEEGLIEGMEEVGILYDKEEYFIPELLSSADAMYASFDILKENLNGDTVGIMKTIVIGTVLGDTHDIGKNIVACFMKNSGFHVVDAGRDVTADRFVELAIEHEAELIILSTIMTTTMKNMAEVIKLLDEKGLHKKIKVMVGGKPISKRFARDIGADGYSVSAADAVRKAKELLRVD